MRVMLVSGDPGYLLRFRSELLRALAEAGHRVTVACGRAEDGVRAALDALPVRYLPLPLRPRGLNPLFEMRTVLALRAAIREQRPELLLSHAPKLIAYTALADAELGRRRFVPMFTGLGSLFIRSELGASLTNRLVRRLVARALRQASAVLFQNPDDPKDLARRGILAPGIPYTVIPSSGVDTRYFAHRPWTDNGESIVLYVGRLMREKGILELVESARRVRARDPSIRFQLVGSPEKRRAGLSRRTLEAWQERGHIEYAGQVPDVRPFLERCSVFAIPSYREGTPRAALEAMSTGRAVVATDVAGCREVVENGRNGYLVPPYRSGPLAETILDLMHDPRRLRDFGEESRRIVDERFEVSRVNRRIMDCLGL